jgi:hypothetical protein
MTTLTATAIISAVDRASAVFARVGAAARAQAGKFAAATAAVNRFGSAAAVGLGAPGALAGALAMKGEYEVDKLTRLMQSAGELNDDQRKMLTKSAFDASLASALQAQEIIKGQRELIQGGLDADTVAQTSTMFAKVARANGIEMAKVTEDSINVANAMGWAMGTTEEKMASLQRAMEFMSIVPNLSTENWEGLRTSLKYAAPVAGALKIRIEELGAALSILADAGFKGEEGGTALRTILTRAIAPTRQARLEMRAFGIALEDLYKFDDKRLGDMVSLRERLLGAGLGKGKNIDRALKGFADPKKFRGAYEMGDALMDKLSGALGIGKGDAESRGILKKVVDGHIKAATEGFDLEGYFQGIAKLPLQAMKEMFGLQRISQAEKLRDGINKIMELPTGERISKFRNLANEFERLMPGSLDRRFQAVGTGFAFSIDRTMRAVESLRNSVFNSGVGEDIAGFFTRLATSIENLRQSDPNALRAVTYGIAGLAALGPAALVLGSVASALDKIGSLLGNKTFRRLALGGGIAGLLFGGELGQLFMAPDVLGRGGVDLQGQFLGQGAPILETIERLKSVFSELGGSVADVAGHITSIYSEMMKLFSLDTSGSVLLDGLSLLNSGLDHAARSIAAIRRFLKGEGAQLEPPTGDWFGDRMRAFRMGPEFLRKFLEQNPNDPLRKFNQSGPGADGAPSRVEVDGRVTGDATVTVKVDQEGRLQAYAPPMKLTGGLNTGRSSPETTDTRPWAK